MTWWQTLFIAVVPALVTALSLIAQQVVVRRSDRQARMDQWDHEQEERARDDLRDAHRATHLALTRLGTALEPQQLLTNVTKFGIVMPHNVEVDGELVAQANLGITSIVLAGGVTSANDARAALDSVLETTAMITEGGCKLSDIHAAVEASAEALSTYTMSAHRDLGTRLRLTPRAPADA
jgi:hypothetical protein